MIRTCRRATEPLVRLWSRFSAFLARKTWRHSSLLLSPLGWRKFTIQHLDRNDADYVSVSRDSSAISAVFRKFADKGGQNAATSEMPVGLWTLRNAIVPYNTKFSAVKRENQLWITPRLEDGPFNYYGSQTLDAASGIYAQHGDDVLIAPPRQRFTVAEAVYVGMRAPHNWGHWLTNFLPGVMLASEFFSEKNSPPLIVPDGYICTSSREELFRYFWNQRPVIRLHSCEELRATNLYWFEQPVYDSPRPSNPANLLPKMLNVEVMSRFRRKLIEFLPGVNFEEFGARNLFLARGSSRDYGGAKINRIAERLGFEIVFPEKLSIHNQILTFSQARRIAGPMGSAFANILFSGPETEALVLAPRYPPLIEDWWAPFAEISGTQLSVFRGKREVTQPYRLCEEEVEEVLSTFISSH